MFAILLTLFHSIHWVSVWLLILFPFWVFFVASHGSCVYKSENRMLTLSFDFSSAAAFQFGGGNVTITLVCGMSLVSSNLHCICNNCYLHVPY